MARRPTLLDSCARAATAAEAAFRINAPQPAPRDSRIIALDPGASEVIRRVAAQSGNGAHTGSHFLTYRPDESAATVEDAAGSGGVPDVVLYTADGEARVRFSEEMPGADMVFMVATADDGADAAAAIGEACWARGIMTGGVVFGDEANVRRAVSALRPHAQVLLVTQDEDDVSAVLTALRA